MFVQTLTFSRRVHEAKVGDSAGSRHRHHATTRFRERPAQGLRRLAAVAGPRRCPGLRRRLGLAVVGLTWLSDQALRGFAGLLAWQPLLPLLWTPACTAASSRHARPLQPCRRPLACRMLPNGPEGQVQISENQSRECTSRHVAPQVPIVAFDHDHAGAGNLSHRQLGCVVFGMLAVAGSTDSITPRREVA